MSRKDYKSVITNRVLAAGYKAGNTPYVYKKNDPQMRSVLSRCLCDEKEAIRRARNQAETFSDRKYHTHNPCTMVYKLVNLLIGEDKEFVSKIQHIIEEK